MAHGDRGQPGVRGLSKDRTGPLTQQLLDGRPAGRIVPLIHRRRRQADILRGISARKTLLNCAKASSSHLRYLASARQLRRWPAHAARWTGGGTAIASQGDPTVEWPRKLR
jgi:hypothetical protein